MTDESEWHQRKRLEVLVYGAHLARTALRFMDTESTAEIKALVKEIEGITSKLRFMVETMGDDE